MNVLTVKRSYVVRVPTNTENCNGICRICRKQCTDQDLVPLFKNNHLRANASMLALIADVKVIHNDRMPDKICLACNKILEKAYVLKTVAKNSDRIFRKALLEKTSQQGSKSKENISKPQTRTQNKKVSENTIKFELSNLDDDLFDNNQTVIGHTLDEKDKIVLSIPYDDGFSQEDDLFHDSGSDPEYRPDDDEDQDNKELVRKQIDEAEAKLKARQAVPDKLMEYKKYILLKRKGALKEKLKAYKNRSKPLVRVKKEPRPKSEPFSLCSICGAMPKNMKAHQLKHKEKNLKCELCPMTYRAKAHLNAHMKKHTGVKDFKCELCGAAFYEKKGLVRHMLMHTQTRPYKCHICSKSFSYSNVLHNHMNIHLNRRPFSCDVCDRPFRTKVHLATHMVIHTGERPFACKICDVSFAYKVNLNQHMARHHGVNWKYKPIRCVTADVLQEEKNKDALKGIQGAQHHLTVHTTVDIEEQDQEYVEEVESMPQLD